MSKSYGVDINNFARTGLTNNFCLLVKENIIIINKLQPRIDNKRVNIKKLEAINKEPNNYEIMLKKMNYLNLK